MTPEILLTVLTAPDVEKALVALHDGPARYNALIKTIEGTVHLVRVHEHAEKVMLEMVRTQGTVSQLFNDTLNKVRDCPICGIPTENGRCPSPASH